MAEAAVRKGDHQNVARVAQVMDILAGAKETGLRLTDVVERSGLGVATVHRLLNGLVDYGFVDHDGETNRYFVGLKMLGWVAAATERYGLAGYVEPALERLARDTEDTIYFSLPSGYDSLCVDRREGSYPIKTLTLSVGDRRPLGVGAGSLALLAFQPETQRDRILAEDGERRRAFGIDGAYLAEAVAASREAGYSLNPGRLIRGMYAVGVPIRRADGPAVAALSVAALSERLSGERLDLVVGRLKAEAAAIEEQAAAVLSSPLAKRHSARRA